MRVFFTIKGINKQGGTERMTSLIANALYEKGHEVHIASFIGGGSRPFFHIDSGIPIHYLTGAKDSFFLWRDRLRIIRLRRLYREYRPDVIIAVDAGRSRIYAPAAKGFRTVTWEHFNIYYSKNPRTRRSRRLAARYSDCIVTLTQRDAEGYLHKLKARKVVCIPNPITIDCSEPSPMTARTVLSMGRIVPQKGQDLLVRAWQRIADKAEGWKLRIVGDGPLLAEVKEYVEKNGMSGSVEFLPTTKDVQAMYRQASIYAMSSRFEGLPLVLIEAQSMGLPIVSFDCLTGPAEIVDNGRNGILVPPLDVDALAEALLSLMHDDRRRKEFSDNALTAASRFDYGKIVGQWEKLLREI